MEGENNTLDLDKFEEIFQKEYESIVKNNGKCNAMVLGGTGVGKSTLINAVFGFSKAETGTGQPITQTIELHSHPNSPINIYDTPGLELNAKQIIQTTEEVVQLIADKKINTDPREHIHFVWYCINERSSRFQDAEKDWIEDLVKQEVPVIIVLTQTYDPENSQLLDYIKNLNLPVYDIIPVLAKPAEITKTITVPKYGLENLIHVTLDSFPQQAEKARVAAIAAQRIDIDIKISKAEEYLQRYVFGSLAAGSPITSLFGGLAVAGVQVAMIAHLTAICGLKFNLPFLWQIYSACASGSIPTLITASIPILDLATVPTTAIMTFFIGKAFLFGYEMYLQGQISEEQLADTIVNRFNKILQEKELLDTFKVILKKLSKGLKN